MHRIYLSSVLIALFSLFSTQQAKAQCPTITVTASAVCPNYSSICGCENSMLSYTIPSNYTTNGVTLHYANGTQVAAITTPGNFPSLEPLGTGVMYRNWTIATNPTQYYLSFQLVLNGISMTCNSALFTINSSNANAVPSFNTHALPMVNGVLSGQFITTNFYANDPITFDANPSQNVFEYTVDCTPVTSTGTPTGATVTNWNTYYPSASNYFDYYINLRAMFSNLVNPTGMVLNRYYRIRMYGIGCSGNTITYQKIIRIQNALRPALPGPTSVLGMTLNNESPNATEMNEKSAAISLNVVGIKIAPNPSSGLFTLSSDEVHKTAVITVKSMDGKEVFRQEETDFQQLVIDLSNQPKGMYVLTLETSVGRSIEKITVL
jgi:hypothetical protein